MADELPAHFEDGWRAFLCQMLVDSRDACVWASQHLFSEGAVIRIMKSRWQLDRVKNAIYAWHWAFLNGEHSVLPFSSVCEDLGLDPYAVRNRILAQCSPNPGINTTVAAILQQMEHVRLTRKTEPEDDAVDLEAYGRIFRSKRDRVGHDAEPSYQ
jgi:hypothetical protein